MDCLENIRRFEACGRQVKSGLKNHVDDRHAPFVERTHSSMLPFAFHKSSHDEIERLGGAFCDQHGDDADGNIAEAEYDRLFDHLAEALRRHGTFKEGFGPADFVGSRYVSQVPWIGIVPSDSVEPSAALAAGLEAVSTAHRPLAVSFDFYPEVVLILPPNQVHATCEQSALTPPGGQ
jgi:hypothetical protein